MKKKLITSCIVAVGLIIGIYIIADQHIVETKNLHGGMMTFYDNYEERLKGSDLVVIAELAEDPKNVLTPYGDGYPDGYPDGHHVSKINVFHTIKNEEDFNQKELVIREPYYILDKGISPGKDEIFYGDYTKMGKENKYLLFLSWDEEWGQYGIASAHEGKFNLDGKDEVEQKTIQENVKLQNLRADIFSQKDILEFIE